jgi:tetratricopeptide (TPR) repeat protein
MRISSSSYSLAIASVRKANLRFTLCALELDPALAHPHAVLGGLMMEYQWDFAGGEAEFRKAIELDPSDATAHQWLSEGLCQLGRAQDAIDEGTRAHQLDPLSPIVAAQEAYAYTYAEQYEKAINLYKKLIADNPNFGRAHSELAYAYWGAHKYPEVIQEWKAGSQFEGDQKYLEFANAVELAFHSGGWPAAERKGIEVLLAERKQPGSYVSPYQIAQYYADLGDKDHAFQWLNTAYQEHDVNIMSIPADFALDSLRSDSRYAELVHKIGLPH